MRLGAVAFGGPAAHVALMRHEFVERRRWLSEQRFLDLLGVTNLIPGPNSTEMAIHLGFERAGRLGMVVAGAGFILPAAAIVVALAWAYVEFSTVPAVGWLLYGVKPVVIAVVLHAMWGLGRRAMRTWRAALIGAAVFGLSLLGVSELALLAGGALAGGLLLRPSLITGWRRAGLLIPFLPVGLPGVAAAATTPFGLGVMFLQFLKIGAVLYGSGYVLIAFMRGDFVERFGWLTDRQLLDAIAIGQVTPGPVFTTATFVGYLLGGFAGAAVATLAIFLPSFGFVAVTHPWVSRLRDSRRLSPLLDAVNATAVGLMGSVTLQLGRTALIDPLTAIVGGVALVTLVATKLNAVWLIAGGAVIGLVAKSLGG